MEAGGAMGPDPQPRSLALLPMASLPAALVQAAVALRDA